MNRYSVRQNCPVPVLISEHATKHHWYCTSSTTHGPQIEIIPRSAQAGFASQSGERARASKTVSWSAFASSLFLVRRTCFYVKFWSRFICQSLVTRGYCEQFEAFILYSPIIWLQNLQTPYWSHSQAYKVPFWVGPRTSHCIWGYRSGRTRRSWSYFASCLLWHRITNSRGKTDSWAGQTVSWNC